VGSGAVMVVFWKAMTRQPPFTLSITLGHDTKTERQPLALSVDGATQFEHRVDDRQVVLLDPDHDLLLNEATLPEDARVTLGQRPLDLDLILERQMVDSGVPPGGQLPWPVPLWQPAGQP
jgi:hypothetical protein